MKEMNKKKKLSKKLLIFGLPILALALVSALTFYAVFTVNLTVNQPITVGGDGSQTFSCDAGETCLGEPITVSNSDLDDKVVFVTDNSGVNIVTSYVGKMIFTHKNLYTGTASGDTKEVVYTITGDSFVATGIPSGYELIYYPDMVEGFTTNVANILVYDVDTFPSLPVLTDIGDDYCNILTGDEQNKANPSAKVCSGAKLWLVEDTYTDALKTGVWTPSKIMFETDLITYTVSSDGEVLVPAGSTITIYPAFTPDEHANGGTTPIEITIA